MNHCVPNRVLHPRNAPISQGLVITQPMHGDVVHYVWKEKNTQVYAMMSHLFICKERGIKHTELLRREQVLEFGDNIDFTENQDKEVVDYEKTIKTYETQCLNGKYLLKTLCVLSPEKPRRCWTKAFGFLDITGLQISKQAIHNVALNVWIEIIVNSNRTISPKFHSFEGVAQDDRTVAWEADWNKANKPKTSFSWDHSEDEFDEANYVEKSDEQLLGVLTNLEGVLISRFDIFCPDLKDKRVCVGLWLKDNEVQAPPLGHKLKFDTFYSDILDTYVCYYYEIFPSQVLYFDVARMQHSSIYEICLPLTIQPQDLLGRFYVHPYFGLIADPLNFLGILLYIDLLPSTPLIHAFVVDKRPSLLTRFEIQGVPTEVMDLINDSEVRIASQPIVSEGFYVNPCLGMVYSPKYPTEIFQFANADDWNAYPAGTWIRFNSEYNPESNDRRHYIYKHSILREKSQVECALVDIHYEFKIEVEHHPNHKHMLYSRLYGFVADPDKKFVSKAKYKKFDVIVQEDMEGDSLTLFKIKRMAKPNERLRDSMKSSMPRNVAPGRPVPIISDFSFFSSSEEDSDEEDAFPIAEKFGDLQAEMDQDEIKLSQVEFNQKYSIRERQLKARARKQERDRIAKMQADY